MTLLLNNMRYDLVAFQLTKECSAACKICCGSYDQKLKGKIDLNAVQRFMDTVKNTESVLAKRIRIFSVTGGEPFLYPDDVLSIAKHSKDLNRMFTIATNAFWSTSYTDTLRILTKLKDNNNACGCILSVDSFHQECIPVENIKIFLRVCKILEIPVKIQSHVLKSTFAQTDEIIKSLGEDKLQVEMLYGGAYPVGSAKKHFPPEDFYTKKLKSTVCQYQGYLHVSTNGQVQPCCSPCFGGIPFNVGNIYNDSLEDILTNIQNNALMRMIINEGFEKLIKEAREKFDLTFPDEFVDSCHLCNFMLSDGERYAYLLTKTECLSAQKEEIVSVIRNIAGSKLSSLLS